MECIIIIINDMHLYIINNLYKILNIYMYINKYENFYITYIYFHR